MCTRQPLLAMLSLLVPAIAAAGSHKLSAAAAPSTVIGQSTLWGGEGSMEWAPFTVPPTDPELRRRLRPLSFVTDLAVHAGSHDGDTRTQYSLVIGPRFTRGKGTGMHVFLEGLAGPAWTTDEAGRRTDARWVAGGGTGAEYIFASGYGGLQARAKILRLSGSPRGDWYGQISLGVVYRFERPHPD